MSGKGKKRILLVDDDREFVEGIKDLLEAHGYEVQVAHSGAQGVEMAKATHPNLMVLDVMMATDTEGFDVSKEVQNSPDLKGLPVILMTGIKKAMGLPFSFEPDEDWLPVKAVLDKPVPPDKFLAEVASHVS